MFEFGQLLKKKRRVKERKADKRVHVGRDKSACQTLPSLLTEISVAAT